MRVATFCSRRASALAMAGSLSWPGSDTPATCMRLRRTAGLMLATTSTSGTATPKAVPPTPEPVATPMTSVSGRTLRTASATLRAISFAKRSVCAVGSMRRRSSSTCTSKSTELKLGVTMGLTLIDCTMPQAAGALAGAAAASDRTTLRSRTCQGCFGRGAAALVTACSATCGPAGAATACGCVQAVFETPWRAAEAAGVFTRGAGRRGTVGENCRR
mmetsp:Transcript_84793/g.225224  ORF Transcript_84793/g.225224 Transcript_84793/m.225224 type:complete len:217 (-) Transcript_84793:350-1000(-)